MYMYFPLALVNILRVTEHGSERGTRETEPTKEVQQNSSISLVAIQESSISVSKRKELEQTKQVQGGDSGGDRQGKQSLAGEEESRFTQGSDSELLRRVQHEKEQEQAKHT